MIDCRMRGPGFSGVPPEPDISGCLAAGLGEVSPGLSLLKKPGLEITTRVG